MRPGETPVPIPNTMVKPQTADGTALETVWESRWPPATKKKNVIRDMRFEENFRFHMTDKNQSAGQQNIFWNDRDVYLENRI